MRIIGFILVAFGVFALAYGGISYARHVGVLDVGRFKATATEQKNIPLSPIVGWTALLGGVVLLAVPRRRLV